MDTHLIAALRQLDCSPKEIRLYLASFSLGPAKLATLAKKSRLQRSTTYLLCDQLLEKGLLLDDSSAYGKRLRAASPDTLLRLLEARRRRIGRSSLALSDHIDELRQLHSAGDVIPKISTFSGANGLRTARDHILGATSEILLWTNQAAERRVFSPTEHNGFITERIARGLHMRVLATNNPEGQALIPGDVDSLRTTRLLPANVMFTTETYVFDKKVVIIDFTKDIVAIIIENTSIMSAQRAQFELAWAQLTPADYQTQPPV